MKDMRQQSRVSEEEVVEGSQQSGISKEEGKHWNGGAKEELEGKSQQHERSEKCKEKQQIGGSEKVAVKKIQSEDRGEPEE